MKFAEERTRLAMSAGNTGSNTKTANALFSMPHQVTVKRAASTSDDENRKRYARDPKYYRSMLFLNIYMI
jgi:hypothetical protein